MQLRTADARQLITMLGMVILRVRQAQHCDRDELARMRVLLWPDGSFEEHLSELDAALSNRVSGTLPVTILVSQNENGALLGFVEVGLRSHSHSVKQGSSRVGFR